MHSGLPVKDPIELEGKQAFVGLLKQMICVNPADRILPAEALHHTFFRSKLTVTDNEIKTGGGDRTPDNTIKAGDVIRGLTNVYHVDKVLGSGAFGTVVQCRIEGTDELVAIKLMTKEKDAKHEVKILKYLNQHDSSQKFVTKVIECFTCSKYFCIVFELLDRTLIDLLKDRHYIHLTVSEIRPIAKQLLETLGFLKLIGVTHTDIKPDNIMLVNHESQPFRVKLIDFGLAYRTHRLSKYDLMQNVAYRAPEIHLGTPRDESLDLWSLGYTLAFLSLSRPLCPNDEYEAVRIIVKLLGLPSSHSLRQKIKKSNSIYDKLNSLDDLTKLIPANAGQTEVNDFHAFLDLLKQMLCVNPADRILPAAALEHRFITMEHLADARNSLYVEKAHEIMMGVEGRNTNSSAPIDELKDVILDSDLSASDCSVYYSLPCVKPKQTLFTKFCNLISRIWNR
uniref:Protein kinase domain-containing protein n=1 Tax=Nothobranchius furzeri TaxID=105023 RepID=A0A8C6L6Z6_NOTFU